MTKAEQLAIRINKFMNSKLGQNSFRPGKTLSRKWFMRYIPRFFPELSNMSGYAPKDNLAIVKAYTRFNQAMLVCGLQMESRGYYSSFEITSTTRAVDKLERAADAKIDRSTSLAIGLHNHKGRVTLLTTGELSHVSTRLTW